MYDLDRGAISKFARENPELRAHLNLQEKKDKLEDVMRRLQTLSNTKEEQAPRSKRKFTLF